MSESLSYLANSPNKIEAQYHPDIFSFQHSHIKLSQEGQHKQLTYDKDSQTRRL